MTAYRIGRFQFVFLSVLCLTAFAPDFVSMALGGKEFATTKQPSAPTSSADVILKYDDGTPEGKRSIAGTGEMIRFELPDSTLLFGGLRLHCGRYGYPKAPDENVKISIVSEDESEVLHTELVPYAKFKRGECEWTKIPFKKPVTVPKTFWVIVDFNAERTKGVYVSFDTSSGGKYSKVGSPGSESKPVNTGGDWMIQALLAKPK